MSQPPSVRITVYIDFTCPYAYRATRWLDRVKQKVVDRDLTIHWKYFSLEQANLPQDTTWKLWEQPEQYEHPNPAMNKNSDKGLLAFWAAEAARRQGEEAYNRFRQELFRARHGDEWRPITYTSRAKIEPVAVAANLDLNQFVADFNDRSLVDIVRRDHEDAVANHQVFGVPTICFDPYNAIFVKMEDNPPVEDVLPFFHSLRQSFTGRRWLLEVKRPEAEGR